MSVKSPNDRWAAGDAYEDFMGRWSRPLAAAFIGWLAPESQRAWLDVGCGTGALASAICGSADPAAVVACDPSAPFVADARRRNADPRTTFTVAGSDALPERPGGFDHVVSGLVLNFLPEPQRSVEAMRRRARPGGDIAAYVWDYAGRMEFLRTFWDEAVVVDAAARELDEGMRFPICRRDRLETVFRAAGLRDVRSDAIEVPTRFSGFADYWRPFLGGTGPAPAFVASLDDERRAALRAGLESRLAAGPDGAIELVARAWTVRGTA